MYIVDAGTQDINILILTSRASHIGDSLPSATPHERLEAIPISAWEDELGSRDDFTSLLLLSEGYFARSSKELACSMLSFVIQQGNRINVPKTVVAGRLPMYELRR